MNRTGLLFRSIVCTALLSAHVVSAQQSAVTSTAPIPSAILAAKTIFLVNAASDSGMFPSPFTGDPDRAYNQFYTALKASGRYELVADPSDADLVLELHLQNTPNFTSSAKPAPVFPVFCLKIFDKKSHFMLWERSEWIDFSILQKTHDRNFDHALTVLLSDFLALSGKAQPSSK